MNLGEKVRWYLFGLGSEKDFHTAHWHGSRLVQEGNKQTDVIELMPGMMTVADMKRLIQDLGYEPRQRDNWYRLVKSPLS